LTELSEELPTKENSGDAVRRFAHLAYLAYRAPSSDLLAPGFDDALEDAANEYEKEVIGSPERNEPPRGT
jgi:hypothetical protein